MQSGKYFILILLIVLVGCTSNNTPTTQSPTQTIIVPPTQAPTETPTLVPSTATATPEPFDFSTVTPVREFRVEEFDSLSNIPVEVAESAEFDKWLDEQKVVGMCVADFANPAAVKTYTPVLKALEVTWKPVRMISLPNDLYGNRAYTSSTNDRPYYTECHFQTEISGKSYLLWTVKWMNADGSQARIKYVYPQEMLVEENLQYLNIDRYNRGFLTVPATFPHFQDADNDGKFDYEWADFYDKTYYEEYYLKNFSKMKAIIEEIGVDPNNSIPSSISSVLMHPKEDPTRFR